MYDLTFPVLIKTLRDARQLVEKGAAWADEKGVAASEFMTWRIYEDMMPLWEQVGCLKLLCSLAATNLAGQELSVVEVKVTGVGELYTLIDKAIEELEGITDAQIKVKESTAITCQMGPEYFSLPAMDFARWFIIPHTFFHITTLYNIMRMKGVPLGKKDYMLAYIHDVRGDVRQVVKQE